jgi:transcriptional regulator with PAS, ATPase and Fis domain
MEATTPTFSRSHVVGVLDSMDDPAVLLSDDLTILASNRAYRRRFGEDAQTLVGRRCYEVSHRFSRPCNEEGETCPVLECRISGEPCRTLHVHHTGSGPEHHEATTYPVMNEDGRVGSYLEIFRCDPFDAIQKSQDQLVGHSFPFNRMLEMVRRVAPTSTTALLLGESGTGKELVARAIHALSPRAGRAFVPVECSGLSESLFESELFGHEKGAFTGATQGKMGLVEAAEGGTLFLDEVGDIPLAQQVKLLRLIETGIYRRVGSVNERRTRFRLVCATHRNLPDLVHEGGFRADLYYRISAFPIHLPPLRDHLEDLPALVDHLMKRLESGRRLRVHPDTLKALRRYSFPGNVRELLNIIERACLLADGEILLPRHLPSDCLEAEPQSRVSERPYPCGDIVPLSELESCYLREVTTRFDGTNRELADRLGVSERTLYRKLSALKG